MPNCSKILDIIHISEFTQDVAVYEIFKFALIVSHAILFTDRKKYSFVVRQLVGI